MSRKPLSLTVAEGLAMVDAARSNERVVQTGSQQRSSPEFRRAAEAIRNGRLGTIQEIVVGLPGVNFEGPPVADTEPPPELDYDFWLGPAPERPYNPKQVHYNFRFFWPFAGGQMTNWGAHHLDIVQWALGRDDSGPISVEPIAIAYHPEGWYEVPQSAEILYRYEDGPPVRCRMGLGDPNGVRFNGSEGSLFVGRGEIHRRPRPGRRLDGAGRPPRSQRGPRSELARLHQVARPADLRRGGRPSFRDGLPPGQHRRPDRPTDPMGSGSGTDHRRRRSRGDALSTLSIPLVAPGLIDPKKNGPRGS